MKIEARYFTFGVTTAEAEKPGVEVELPDGYNVVDVRTDYTDPAERDSHGEPAFKLVISAWRLLPEAK